MTVFNVVGLTLRSGGSLPHRNTADRGERREEDRRVCPHNIVGGEGGTYGCARQNAFQSSEEGVEVVVLGGVEDALHLKLRIPALLAGGRVEVLGGGAVGRRAERVGVEGAGGRGVVKRGVSLNVEGSQRVDKTEVRVGTEGAGADGVEGKEARQKRRRNGRRERERLQSGGVTPAGGKKRGTYDCWPRFEAAILARAAGRVRGVEREGKGEGVWLREGSFFLECNSRKWDCKTKWFLFLRHLPTPPAASRPGV